MATIKHPALSSTATWWFRLEKNVLNCTSSKRINDLLFEHREIIC